MEPPQSLVLFTQHFPPATNAAACRWRLLADALADGGYHLDIYGCASADTWRPELRVHSSGRQGKGFGLARRLIDELVTFAKTLRGAMRGPKPEAVIATIPALGLLPSAWLVAKLRGVPLVLDLRDTWPELLSQWREWGDDGTGKQKASPAYLGGVFSLAQKVLFRMRRSASVAVVTTVAFAEELRRDGIKNVVIVRSVPPLLTPVPRDGDHDELRILYLGTVGRAQKLATAIKAASLASREVPITLRVVGGGAEVASLREFAKSLDAPVEFVDRVPAEDVPQQYRWADSVLVMLRDWPTMAHTVPSKLYEALSTGVHISASVEGEAATIVRAASAGTVTAPSDAEALAVSWVHLAKHRALLEVGDGPMTWVRDNADRTVAAERFVHAVQAVSHERA